MLTFPDLVDAIQMQLDNYDGLSLVQMKALEENIFSLYLHVRDDRTLKMHEAARAYARAFEGG